MEVFSTTAGISLTHVPYKGATQAALDIVTGQVSVGFQGLSTVAALVRGGKLRLIAVTTRDRLPQFPDVPTMSESGLAGFEFNSWFTLMAPARTPRPIIARLNDEVMKALADPEVRERLNAQGLTVRGTSAEELATATRAQLAKYARVMKEANIKND
jgi:tripartite-type tricarboxylate transporter receptor subunit TctC